MTEALFSAVSVTEEELYKEGERRLNVSGVLRILGVSRSGYNVWRKREPSNREKHKELIKDKIMDLYNKSFQNYGAPKITEQLNAEGIIIAEKTVGNYMREMGIKAQYIKPYTITTIDSNFSTKLKNILDANFNPDEPNAVWCSDITYIYTYTGFVYLTSIMDLFSRKIIAWTLSTTLEAKWVVETINNAKANRNISKPLIMHTDRGIQYVSSSYMEATANMINSYSKKAYPWDNACLESFHALIKREWLNRVKIFDYNHAYRLVFEYINTFYNTVRIHSYCNYLSPNQYEIMHEKELEKMFQRVS